VACWPSQATEIRPKRVRRRCPALPYAAPHCAALRCLPCRSPTHSRPPHLTGPCTVLCCAALLLLLCRAVLQPSCTSLARTPPLALGLGRHRAQAWQVRVGWGCVCRTFPGFQGRVRKAEVGDTTVLKFATLAPAEHDACSQNPTPSLLFSPVQMPLSKSTVALAFWSHLLRVRALLGRAACHSWQCMPWHAYGRLPVV
jgi:hypothetical protein